MYQYISTMQTHHIYKRELVQHLCQITDPKEMEAALADLLTPKELEDVVLRLQIIKLLDKKIPQRNIAKKLSISIAKVTHGSRMLQEKPKGKGWQWALGRQQ